MNNIEGAFTEAYMSLDKKLQMLLRIAEKELQNSLEHQKNQLFSLKVQPKVLIWLPNRGGIIIYQKMM